MPDGERRHPEGLRYREHHVRATHGVAAFSGLLLGKCHEPGRQGFSLKFWPQAQGPLPSFAQPALTKSQKRLVYSPELREPVPGHQCQRRETGPFHR